MWQLHLEYGVEPTHSCWIHALPGTQGVRVSSKRCVPAARAGCGAATNLEIRFLGHFRRFWLIYVYPKFLRDLGSGPVIHTSAVWFGQGRAVWVSHPGQVGDRAE